MAKSSHYKTKAQERERIRQNQQRSRERRRAYVAELELKVRQLSERLPTNKAAGAASNDELLASIERVKRENDAMRKLLRVLGIDDRALQQLPREGRESGSAQPEMLDVHLHGLTSGINGAESVSSPELFPDIGADWSLDPVGTDASCLQTPTQLPNYAFLHYPSESSVVPGFSATPFHNSQHRLSLLAPAAGSSDSSASGVSITAPADLTGLTSSPAAPSILGGGASSSTNSPITAAYTTAFANSATSIPPAQPALTPLDHPADPGAALSSALSTTTAISRDPEPRLGSCLQNTVLHIDAFSDGTTLCSIAFSMIFQNNSRGYSTAELEKRLQAGYRKGVVPTEGCRVVNKVLFRLLAEIS